MRFRVQWFSVAAQEPLAGQGAASRWLYVGGGALRSTQSGYSFQFADPPDGSVQFAARWHFQWRGAAQAQRRYRGGRSAPSATPARGFQAWRAATRPGRSEALCVDQARNRRGSLVITRVHAQRLQARDLAGVVHGPHVELAAGLVHRAHQPAAHQQPVGHDRLALPRAGSPARPVRAGPARIQRSAP